MEYKIVKKSDSCIMKICSWLLNVLKIMDSKKFMTKYYTTFRKTIYTPDLNKISKEIIEHELIHVQQWRSIRFYTIRYLNPFSGGFRAERETEAYLKTRSKKTTYPWLLKRLTKHYVCSNDNVFNAWVWYHKK